MTFLSNNVDLKVSSKVSYMIHLMKVNLYSRMKLLTFRPRSSRLTLLFWEGSCAPAPSTSTTTSSHSIATRRLEREDSIIGKVIITNFDLNFLHLILPKPIYI